MLTQVVHSHPLVTIVELGEQLGMAHDDAPHLAEGGVDTHVAAGEGVAYIAEEPWPPLAPATDRHSGTPGFVHHRDASSAPPDVAVAEHRYVERAHELTDPAPIRMTAIVFGSGAGMQVTALHPSS